MRRCCEGDSVNGSCLRQTALPEYAARSPQTKAKQAGKTGVERTMIRMSDENKGDKKTGKPLTLRGGTETSRVRQSFSHGRTKSVVVEKKRKRVIVPGKPGTPGASTSSGVKNA